MYRIHEICSIGRRYGKGATSLRPPRVIKAPPQRIRLSPLRRRGSGAVGTDRCTQVSGAPAEANQILLDRDPLQLPEVLGLQGKVLEEKRRRLDRAIGAIANAEKLTRSGKPAGAAVLKQIIEAIEMQSGIEDATEFMKNYYREDVWASFKARHRDWPSHKWKQLFREIESSLAGDPASPAAIPRFLRAS